MHRDRLYTFVTLHRERETPWDRLKHSCAANNVDLQVTFNEGKCTILLNDVVFGEGTDAKRSTAKRQAVAETLRILDTDYPAIQVCHPWSIVYHTERYPTDTTDTFIQREFESFVDNPAMDALLFRNVDKETYSAIQRAAFVNGYQAQLADNAVMVSRQLSLGKLYTWLLSHETHGRYRIIMKSE